MFVYGQAPEGGICLWISLSLVQFFILPVLRIPLTWLNNQLSSHLELLPHFSKKKFMEDGSELLILGILSVSDSPRALGSKVNAFIYLLLLFQGRQSCTISRRPTIVILRMDILARRHLLCNGLGPIRVRYC